ncbi:hypothetical protein HS125_12500 [bacterium]|nr:hypothetical protein [bacterium]
MKRPLVFVLVLTFAVLAIFLFLRRRDAGNPTPSPWRDALDRVDLRVFLTGQTQSYLDVCGCATRQEGGLAPRATLLSDLRKQASATICLDAGGLLGKSESLDVERAEVNLAAMEDMNYDAVLLSGPDLARGYELLAGLAQDSTLEFISCNVAAADGREAFWSPFRILERGGRKLAVIGLSRLFGVGPPAQVNGFVFLEYLSAFTEARRALQSFEPDLTLLLCDLAPGLDDAVLASLPGVDLILTFGVADATGAAGSRPVLFSVPKGMRLTWADVEFSSLGPRFSSGERSVSEGVPKDPVVQRRLEQFYQRIVDQYGPSSPKPLAGFKEEKDEKNFYVGATFCKDCHKPEYAQWETTTHSIAYNLLYGPNRHYAPDVFAYYVTGWGAPTGFHRVDPTHPLAHVGCETCHGPGGRHLESEKKEDIRGKVGKDVCLACHVPAWDPHFEREYDQKLKAVLHRPAKDAGD